MKKTTRGRNRKFRNGDVVVRDGRYGVVIGWTKYGDGSTAYLVYPTDEYGKVPDRATWVRSTKLDPVMSRAGKPRRVVGWTRWRASSKQ